MAISNVMTRSLLSASSAMKQVRAQEGIKKQMEGKAGVLKAEIKQDIAPTSASEVKTAITGSVTMDTKV